MRLGITVLGVALSAGLMFAQGPGQGRQQRGGGPPAAGSNVVRTPPDPAKMVERRVSMLTRWLELAPDQVTQATSIFTGAATASQAVRTSMQSNHKALREAVKANSIAGIDQAANALGSATAQITSIDAKAEAAFYAILTADQKARYDRRGAAMGPMGAGPMGGGPMGGGPMGRRGPRE